MSSSNDNQSGCGCIVIIALFAIGTWYFWGEKITALESAPGSSIILDTATPSPSKAPRRTSTSPVIQSTLPTSELTIAVSDNTFTCRSSGGAGFTFEVGRPPYPPEQALVFGRGFLPSSNGVEISEVEFPTGTVSAKSYQVEGFEEWPPSHSYLVRRITTDFPQYGMSMDAGTSNNGIVSVTFGNYFAFVWGDYSVDTGDIFLVGIYESKACTSLP